MKRLGSFAAILFTLIPLLALPASAQVMSISQQIHIRGVVPPMRFIVVDAQGHVREVTSNTPENITPVVRLDSIAHGATLPLTPALLQEYRQKTVGHDMHSLDLHFAPPAPPVVHHSTPVAISILQHISLLAKPFHI